MTNNRRAMENRRRDSGEFIQDQLRLADNETSNAYNKIETTAPSQIDINATAVEGLEPNSNLFVSGHMVDPLANMYDFDATPTNKTVLECAEGDSEEETFELGGEIEYHASREESRFPESREVYLGVLGLLKKQGVPVKETSTGETQEKDIAEWYLKRRPAFRPTWGQLHA